MWTEEPRKQHGYLTGQFSETYSTFTETYGHIFARMRVILTSGTVFTVTVSSSQ